MLKKRNQRPKKGRVSIKSPLNILYISVLSWLRFGCVLVAFPYDFGATVAPFLKVAKNGATRSPKVARLRFSYSFDIQLIKCFFIPRLRGCAKKRGYLWSDIYFFQP